MSSRNSKDSGLTDVEMGPLMGQASMASEGSVKSTLEVAKKLPSSANKKTTKTANTPKVSNAPFAKVAWALFMYGFCSVGMVLVNKSLSSSYNRYFENDINILLVVFQAITAVISVQLSKMAGFVNYPSFNINTAKQWAPVNVLFCLMLFTGMASLKHNSVPMVTVFKNVTNIFTTAGDNIFFGTPVESLVILAFGVMLAGAIAAAWNDIYITYIGLFWMLVNSVITSAYIIALKFATRDVKLSKFGMVFYNNVLCTFFLLPVAFIMGDIRIFFNTSEVHTFDYFIKNFFAGFVGFFLNFASLNCVSVTGPTTYVIAGSLYKIPTTILGWILFDSVIKAETWFFISLSLCGGFIYSYAKIKATRKKYGASMSK